MAINTNYYNYQNAAPLFNRLGSGYTISDPIGSMGSLTAALQGKTQATPSNGSYGSVDQAMREYVVGMKDNATALKSAVNALTGRASSPYNKVSVASSDPESVQVASSPYRATGDIAVQVDQVATAQVNGGVAQNSADAAGLSGYQQFAIDMNGKSYQFSFTANANDTNRAIQQKMADAINSKDLGFTAQITAQEGGQSALSVQAAKTGALQTFTVRDVSGTAVEQSGLATVKQAGQDALYRVDGGAQRASATNEVDLGNGTRATLKAVTSGEVTLSPEVDAQPIRDKMASMVESYNNLLAPVDDSKAASGTAGGDKLRRELTSIAKTYASSLSKIGVNIDSNGYLSIDKTKMDASIENGSLQSFLTTGGNSSSYGFANKLMQAAGNIGRAPTAYMGGVYPNAVEQIGFDNQGSNASSSSMDYKQWVNTNAINQIGVMFNFLI